MTRHSAMLTNLILSLSLATGLLCATSNASAQTTERVTIPFAFSADHLQFPAGTYEISRLSDVLMTLCNLETRKTQLMMVRLEGGREVQTRGRLIFYHDETGNTLTQVWVAGTTIHSELTVQPKLQQIITKNQPPAGSVIEVAMK
jgi:hypothetical protein